ncbi:ABC transporter substrate-binding protein [Methylopila musalis]|uniref:ABC transporter substrate-binding protein n=1 Tax=Methylopila musalis TaxID=1134781 RepID=A0ABW3Z3S3_9HYPH
MSLVSRRAVLGGSLAALSIAAAPKPARAGAVTVEVGYVPFVTIAQLFVIAEEGWAKEAGIDLKPVRFSSGPALIQAVASGKFEATYCAVSPVTVARAAGVDLKIVATNGIESVSLVAGGPLSDAFGKAKSPAEAFALFKSAHGRPAKLGALPKGTIPDSALRFYLEANGVPASDTEILGQGEEQVRQALLAKAIDGAAMPEPVISIALAKDPTARVVANGRQLLPGQPGFVLSLRESFIKAHPEAARTLVALNDRATELIKTDPQRAVKSVLKHLGRGLIPEDVLLTALTSPYNPVSSDPNLILASTEQLQDFQVRIGAQSRAIPNDELFDLSFYNALKGGR